ncbi:MAG: peptide deformylase, partial [Acholeplasmatales bacterium]|nr:peptide deformylase [Acholeplasmatales bacterium]
GCLSLVGVRKTKRYKKIKVEYLNTNLEKRIKTFKDFTAEIIQHEIDHLEGIII